MISDILSQVLYGLSGFLFGVFSCRFGTISTNKMKVAWAAHGFTMPFLLTAIPSLLFLLTAIFLFPIWLSTRTQLGAFVYLATFIFYSSRNRRIK